jgi:CheY-like chemotaxis protein
MKTLKVLFIEDDVIEVMKLKRTISTLKLNHEIIETANGEEALINLDSSIDLPDIILMDLNMPKMNGLELLKKLRLNERYRFIPTVVLSTSNNRSDILKCYDFGISGYIAKPLKYEDYVRKIENLLAYWSINEFIK